MTEFSLAAQVGALREAVETLKDEVQSLRKEVSELTQARASVKFVFTLVGSMVAIGAAISEIVHIFWARP